MTGNDVNALLGLLSDPDAITWTVASRIVFINAGLRDIAAHKPKATTVTAPLLLVAGLTRQVKPADTIAVQDLTVNLGGDGATPGRAITTVSAERLAASRPSWRTDKGPAVKHLVVDDRDREAFYVWPALSAGGYVEALLHKHPAPITQLTDTLPLDDSYLNALSEYVLHMAYAQDGENPDHAALSVAHYNKYANTLGIQAVKQKRASAPANSADSPAHPAVDKNGA